MAIVLKFGGTSVANGARIRNVANLIASRYLRTKVSGCAFPSPQNWPGGPSETPQAREGGSNTPPPSQAASVVVVVSAMAGATNQLSKHLQDMGSPPSSEDDVVLSSGEAVSTALLAIALEKLGFRARSFLGWQLPIQTDEAPRRARILSVNPEALQDCLAQGIIPIVAGFQGVTSQGRLTTLGRGGSDTTAVALAAALGAQRCDIYTDVDGVYAADPRAIPLARKWETIPYEAMVAMASAGAKVLQARSVELAARHSVPVRVLSSFIDNEGTTIANFFNRQKTKAESALSGFSDQLERPLQRAAKYPQKEGTAPATLEIDKTSRQERSPMKTIEGITLTGLSTQNDIVRFEIESSAPFQALAHLLELTIRLDVAEVRPSKGATPGHLTLLTEALAAEVLEQQLQALTANGSVLDFHKDASQAKVSLVGIGIDGHNEVLSRVLKACSEQKIALSNLNISPLQISFLVPTMQANLAVLSLYEAFKEELGTISDM